MAFVRLYTGPDGESHFEDLDLLLEPDDLRKTLGAFSPAVATSPSYVVPENTKAVIFSSQSVENAPNYALTKQRHFLITLSGMGEIEVGGGEVRRLEPSDVWLLEDTTGKGHITRIPEKPWGWVAIMLAT